MSHWICPGVALQGLSHPPISEVMASHAVNLPTRRPLIVSECCSCQSQRGEDTGTANQHHAPPKNSTHVHYSAFNADCLLAEVNMTDSIPWVAGSMIWTLGDYIGEPAPIDWPHVSSSFGAVDIAGFPKAGARWFQAWWLYSHSPLWSASRPPLPTGHMVHIVESNVRPSSGGGNNRTIHVYSSGVSVELDLDGVSQGVRSNGLWMGWTQWNLTIPPNATMLKAVARDLEGKVVATHTRVASAPATAIALSIDAPSRRTGTGTKVVLDGHDVALVRATVVDASAQPVPTAAHNITFEVISGPGRVLGVGNGDPACKQPHQSRWRSAYNGLARAIIKVTEDAASSAATRALMLAVDIDSGRSTVHIADPKSPVAPTPITVRASAPGLASSTVVIDVSVDASVDGVLNTAATSLFDPISLD